MGDKGVELGEHQISAMKELSNGKVLVGGVGSGKSRTALAYFLHRVCGAGLKINGFGEWSEPQRPRDLYIITTAKKREEGDWSKEGVPFGLLPEVERSVGNIRVTVDSWNNLRKYIDVKDAFFIFDEQRLVGTGAWVKVFLKLVQANQWILLTATPGDAWIEYSALFIAQGWYKNITDFREKHVIWKQFSKYPQIAGYHNTEHLERYRSYLLIEMPFNRHTTRHVKTVLVDHDKDVLDRVVKQRWHIYNDRPIKDVGELFIVMRKVVNSDPSRLGAVMEIVEKHPRLIVFYNFNYELEMLRTLGDILDIEVAEWNGHKHESVPEGDRWLYLVQYMAGAEGWNCTSTDAICFYSQTYSYKAFEQSQGRIDRMNTLYTDLYYYVLRSTAQIDKAINRALVGKKAFNERSSALAKAFEKESRETDD